MCANQSVILSFYLLTFAGIAIGALLLAPLTDPYGKKYFFIASLISILIIYSLVTLASDDSLLHTYMLAYGMALAVCIISGILWVLQLMPKRDWPFTLTIFLIAEACMCFVVAAYFNYLRRSWKTMIEVACIILFILVAFLAFLPESLRHLYDK